MTSKRLKKVILGLIVAAIGIEVLIVWPNTTEAIEAQCAAGSCPKEVRIINDGQRLTYRVGRYFSLVLDKHNHNLDGFVCKSEAGDVVQPMKTFDYAYPYRAKRFELINPGECVLQDGEFTATIVVVK